MAISSNLNICSGLSKNLGNRVSIMTSSVVFLFVLANLSARTERAVESLDSMLSVSLAKERQMGVTEEGENVKRSEVHIKKRLSTLENEVRELKAMNVILVEFCRSVANKEQLSLLSYQQLNSPSADSNDKVRMLLEGRM